MRKIRKAFQDFFKFFSYKVFSLFYGKIKGKINFKDSPNIKTEIINKENNLRYKIYIIKNARLYTDRIHDAAIIINNFIVEGPSYQLRHIIDNNTVNNVDVEKNIVFQKGTPRIKKRLNGRVLSLLTGGGGNTNFFHWIFDVLPRFALCEKIIDLKNVDFFLLPSIEKKFQKETLDLLNIPNKKRISSKFFRHIDCAELFVTDHPHNVENDASKGMQNLPIWISEWLREKFISNELKKNINTPKKIYIDRSDSTANSKDRRLITNEIEVKNFLTSNGFEAVTLANINYVDQIKIFNNAEIIVGLHGAGFANLCYCKPGTKIIEFKSHSGEIVIRNLAISNKLIYKSISDEISESEPRDQFGNVKVPIDLLKKIIASLN